MTFSKLFSFFIFYYLFSLSDSLFKVVVSIIDNFVFIL